MGYCTKADALASFAEEQGWDTELRDGPERVDLTMRSGWHHPDETDGWQWGVALCWFKSEHGGWRLGALDDAGRRVIGGVAEHFPEGPEFEFWLGSVKMLRDFILEPDDFVSWFEQMAPR